MSDTPDAIEPLIESLLKEIGEDPGREGLVHTPHRVAEAVRFFTEGYGRDPQEILNDALFEVDYDEMVIVKDVDFYSLCEHHLLPFFGRAHVAYIPNGKIVVVIEAIHLCMMMRGVESPNASAITSSMRGEFERDSKARAEFMTLIGHRPR
jgi:GTP cyclohydrolase I